MDPVLSWVVCILSAFLLIAGGFLLSRAVATRRFLALLQELEKLKVTLGQVMAERKKFMARGETQRQENQQLKGEIHEARAAASASAAAAIAAQSAASGDGFYEPTNLPDPESYFRRESVPRMRQVSHDEFEIAAAAPLGREETERRGPPSYPDLMADNEETKQFSLHSPEAVTHFLQRIDDLTDENRELKASLQAREEEVKFKHMEGSEQIQRFAALDATVDKLRQELERRAAQTKRLEERLSEQLAARPAPPLARSANPAPPSRSRSSGGRPPTPPPAPRGLDEPTLEVRRLDPHDILGARKPGGSKP